MLYEFKGLRPYVHEEAFVHPQANVTGNVEIYENVYIGPGAVVRGDWGKIVIKAGANVQENCVIHMFPGITVSPPYFLTPNLRPALSRPFLDDPPAFFVAINFPTYSLVF